MIKKIAALLNRVKAWIEGADFATADGTDQTPDPIEMATKAIMETAANRRSGSVIFIPDVVTVALPEDELTFWNPRLETLSAQVRDSVAHAARKAAKRGGRTIVQEDLRVVLVAGDQPMARASYSQNAKGSLRPEATALMVKPDGGPAGGTSLRLFVEDALTASAPASTGLEIGRDPECQLTVPGRFTQVSRFAATVQRSSPEGLQVLITNRNGAWIAAPGEEPAFRPTGTVVSLREGTQLLLDPDAQTRLELV